MTVATWQSRRHRGNRILFLCLAGLLLGVVNTVFGAEVLLLPEFLLRSWDSEAGLPAARIQAVAQTDDGYLWIGTARGLARFDRFRFVVLNTNNTPQLGDNRITSLLVARSGDLWVGTENGSLSRRRRGVFEPVSLGGHTCVRINTLVEDHDAALWIGTKGAGVARWRQGATDWYSVEGTENANDITQVITDLQGRLWSIAGQKLATFEGGSWRIASGPVASVADQVVGLSPAHDGGVWIATCTPQQLAGRGTQLFKLNSDGLTNLPAQYPWRQDSVFTRTARLMEDRTGRLWVATIGAGVFIWSAEAGWQSLAQPGQTSLVECSSLAEDNEGSIWAGTTDFLLFQIRSRQVKTLQLPEPAQQNIVLAACVCHDGSIWVGTDGSGAFCYRPSGFNRVGRESGLDSLHIGVFFEDRQTNFWVGAWDGLYRLEGERFQKVTNFPVLKGVVLAINEDSRANLWIGTSEGIVRLGPDGDKVFARNEGVDHYYIRAIEEDASGQIWVAITDRGLYRKTGERFEHYGAGQWEGEQHIRGLHADADGSLWITTDSHGLARLKDGKFSQWTSDDGLPSDNLVALTEDSSGSLWFSSANGIFGCPKSRLLPYQRGVSPPILFWQLSAAEGLATRRCSGAGQPSVARSSDGHLWFPNWHALAVFDPTNLKTNLAARVFPPLLEEVLVDGVRQPMRLDGLLSVKSATRSFEFHYTSPTPQAPERLRFRYRLMNWDPSWVDAGQQRVAYYSHLPVGSYEFEVNAGGPNGVWYEGLQKLRVKVVPRFWERPWVQGLGALVLLLAVAASGWGVSHARMRRQLAVLERQRALERERSRIARDMHDEVGARLTQISLLTALADNSAGDAAEVQIQTKKISGVARSVTRSLDEIVWAVRPQNDNLESLVDYLGDSLRDLCEGSSVRYWFSGPPVVPAIEVPANVRHNILLASSEVVNNTLKHSGASEARVNARLEGQALKIEITDNGTGFDIAQGEAKNSGLIHIRQRLEEIGGSCICRSLPGEGTRFLFVVPIGAPVFAAANGLEKKI